MNKLTLSALSLALVTTLSGCDDNDSDPIHYSKQDCLAQSDPHLKSTTWICDAVEQVNLLTDISEQQKSDINADLLLAAQTPELACDSDTDFGILGYQKLQSSSNELSKIIEDTELRVCSKIAIHEGYWVSQTITPDGIMIDTINDLHIDAATGSVVVYAQQKNGEQILAPIQIGLEQCITLADNSKACSHPDAVYLNEQGQELQQAEGTGSWWVKHEWNLNDQTTEFKMCNLGVSEHYHCGMVKGFVLEDGLTMQVGTETNYNLRTVYLEQDPVRYSVTLKQATFPAMELLWDCAETASALNGKIRNCPKAQ
ncbi:hypothetical protein [Paraferrimonas sp. SM1919]|uniref:hypothetical protein n=1 Tax=Paraferrimonas sp. SM1919 TaxID=2662263 RepID=UPI0013D4A5F3|nr:hypothetical protein [Paraferrimonas sp. SM1919]